jgi:hypothetical protein
MDNQFYNNNITLDSLTREHRIGNRRAERLRINGSAKLNFCSSYQPQC